jgi:hypothetical protein
MKTTKQQTLFGEEITPSRPSLADRFIVPPFSVLDARQGYWQKRKREWISCGIKGEDGRGENGDADGERLTWVSGNRTKDLDEGSRKILAAQPQSGTSIFDPVACELVYSWFCRESGRILDPFAGGSVRGIVAHLLDRDYTGIELSARQIAANQEQAQAVMPSRPPHWVHGDARDVRDLAAGPYDLIFSCPPYGELERYSDDERDLSTLKYESFIPAYRHIIRECVALLSPDRFACFVVGDFRDNRGFYRNFVSDTIAAFQDAGARLYNEAILITAIGSLSLRTAKQFTASRKLGKGHQNVLVFCKGDPKRATEWLGPMANEESYRLAGSAA